MAIYDSRDDDLQTSTVYLVDVREIWVRTMRVVATEGMTREDIIDAAMQVSDNAEQVAFDYSHSPDEQEYNVREEE